MYKGYIENKPPTGRPGTRGGDPAPVCSTKVRRSAARRYGIEDTMPSVSLATSFVKVSMSGPSE